MARLLPLWLLLPAASPAAATSGAPCTSGFPGDLKVESCAKFCSEKSLGAHCPRCQCKACPFCVASAPRAKSPPPPPAVCSSGLSGDLKFESFESAAWVNAARSG